MLNSEKSWLLFGHIPMYWSEIASSKCSKSSYDWILQARLGASTLTVVLVHSAHPPPGKKRPGRGGDVVSWYVEIEKLSDTFRWCSMFVKLGPCELWGTDLFKRSSSNLSAQKSDLVMSPSAKVTNLAVQNSECPGNPLKSIYKQTERTSKS